MRTDHHDLHHEFPELHEAIHTLKTSNPRFAKLFATYHQLTSQIEDLEKKDMPTSDKNMEDLKKQRVRLKDELYQMLVASR